MPAVIFFMRGDTALIRDFAPGAQTLEGFLFQLLMNSRAILGERIDPEMVRKFKEEWKRLAPPQQ